MRHFALACGLALALSPALPASAQDEVCDAVVDLDTFVGTYTLSIGSALMTGGGHVLTLEAQDTMPATFYRVGDELVMESAGIEIPFTIAGAGEPDWGWEANPDIAPISSDDLALVTGCAISALPRLVGTGTSASSEGVPITFTYRLVAYTLSDSGAQMFGALEWNGGGINQKRVVMLSQ